MKLQHCLIALFVFLCVPVAQAQVDNQPAPGDQQVQSGRPRHPHAQNPRFNPQNLHITGVWQQTTVTTDSTGQKQEIFLPVWKVLQGDGHFVNFVMTYHKAPAFITQEGNYRVVSPKYYSEKTRQSVVAPELVGVEIMMEYTLDEERGQMTLRYMLPDRDQPITETWRKVRLEVPEQLK